MTFANSSDPEEAPQPHLLSKQFDAQQIIYMAEKLDRNNTFLQFFKGKKEREKLTMHPKS